MGFLHFSSHPPAPPPPPPLFLKAYISLEQPKEAAVNGAGYKRMKQEKAVSQPEIASEIDVFLLDSNHVSTNNWQDVGLNLYGFCPAWFNEQWLQIISYGSKN